MSDFFFFALDTDSDDVVRGELYFDEEEGKKIDFVVLTFFFVVGHVLETGCQRCRPVIVQALRFAVNRHPDAE